MKDKPILSYARHPFEDRNQTVEEYLQTFNTGPESQRPAPTCPLCGEDLHIVQLHDRAHSRQFAHVDGNLAPCPLVNDLFGRPPFVTPREPDPVLEEARRGRFIAHWRLHLQAMRVQVPTLSVVRLTRIVAQADVLHLWSCADLREDVLPYVLLVLAEFIAEAPGSARSGWFRFWFDASVQELANLGEPGRAPARLYRLHYRRSRQSMFPVARHLIDWHEVPMSVAFPDDPPPRLTKAEVAAFDAFLEETRAREGMQEDRL